MQSALDSLREAQDNGIRATLDSAPDPGRQALVRDCFHLRCPTPATGSVFVCDAEQETTHRNEGTILRGSRVLLSIPQKVRENFYQITQHAKDEMRDDSVSTADEKHVFLSSPDE